MDARFKQSHPNALVQEVQSWLHEKKLFAILIRSTDRYFNEYVPKDRSIRALITKFDGSVGDAVITTEQAHLFVDGRYSLQARAQASEFEVHVCENNQSIENSWLSYLAGALHPGQTLCIDPATLSLNLARELFDLAQKKQATIAQSAPELFNALLSSKKLDLKPPKVWQVGKDIAGASPPEKIAALRGSLDELGIHAFLMVKLDDIAWALNLRGNSFPFQTAVPGIAALLPDGILAGLCEELSPQSLKVEGVEFVTESAFFQSLSLKVQAKPWVCGIDPSETSLAHQTRLQGLGIEVKQVRNPLLLNKAQKNEKERLHMRRAFKTADQVVHQAQNFVTQSYESGRVLSEGEIDDFVQKSFADSGATDLSFRPICAGGSHGAIIHYGTPDRQGSVEPGALFLLDTGAYYEGGYATDLTRTFLAAGPKAEALPWQKQMFTLVLKASINGLSARIRRGTLGMQLDAIVRAPLWQAGLDFAHGTGHGVGINVHEFPPRIGPTSTTPLLEHQIFSIEPGLYFEGLGGVRIENLATLVADPKNRNFLRVLPLTFCPFDERLIDRGMLSKQEEEFLDYFEAQWRSDEPWPQLPPLKDMDFTAYREEF